MRSNLNKFSLMAIAMAAAVGDTGGIDTSAFHAEGTAPATPQPAPAAPNEYTQMQPVSFHFKSEKVKDADGNVLADKKGPKHPSVNVFLPVPKTDRLVALLSNPAANPKEVELIQQAIATIVYQVARGQINDFREKNPAGVVTPAVLNFDLLDLTAIANMPKSERGSFVPADEDMKAFLTSYLELMPAITNKSADKISKHVDIIATGFKKQRGQKDMLEFFRDALATYSTNVPAEVLEDHMEVVEYLDNRLERMLKVEEKVSMDDL